MGLEKLVKWFCYEDKDFRFNPNSNITFFLKSQKLLIRQKK